MIQVHINRKRRPNDHIFENHINYSYIGDFFFKLITKTSIEEESKIDQEVSKKHDNNFYTN